MTHDVFVRIHTAIKPKRAALTLEPKWPARVLVIDMETTLDTDQDLTLGAFRLCKLVDDRYVCVEEGLIRPDEVTERELRLFEEAANAPPAVEVKTFPPATRLLLLTRREFVEQRFFKTLRHGGMVACFNQPFDLSRLAIAWRPNRDGGWSLILSDRKSHRTGEMEPNPDRPCVQISARSSRSAFVGLSKPIHPEEWPRRARLLDLHTLAKALYETSFSLEGLCERFKVPGKLKHRLAGRVTAEEIRYCREDVRATVAVLNGLKTEFDRHPVELLPDQAASAASVTKAYFDQMGIIPPIQKFRVSDRVHGIAMQAYYGGRTEARIRHVEVPVIHTDFKSQYPTVNALLGNWRVLTASHLQIDEATATVRRLLNNVTLDQTFLPEFWRELSFFALVRPDNDILPVRSLYNGSTTNIGSSFLKSDKPMWFAGPDLVASVLLAGKVPKILQAIRLNPQGTQKGLRPVRLRSQLAIDPRRDDFFRRVVEQRARIAKEDPLNRFLKTMANAGSYGLFIELNPKRLRKRKSLRIHSGGKYQTHRLSVVEHPGHWYFPPFGALIPAGGRLLLAMLERCVRDADGSYLFCDTDSMCIVGAKRRGWVVCPGGPASKRRG